MYTPHVASFSELDGGTLYRLLQLRSDVFVVEQECAYPDLDGLDIDETTRHLWLSDDLPLAYLRITREPDHARIGRVCTRNSHRGQGLASVLIAQALTIVPGETVILHAQTHVTDLYRGHGFEICGPQFLEDGIPHVPMRRFATDADAKPSVDRHTK